MAKVKKNITRLVLQGISILGIFFGFACLYCAIAISFLTQSNSLAILCRRLIFSGGALVLGIYMIYTSYLMLRWKAFGAMKLISALLALFSFGCVQQIVQFFTTPSGSGKMVRFIGDIAHVASLLLLVLVYLICVKLFKKLLEVADRPPKNSGTLPSADKQSP